MQGVILLMSDSDEEVAEKLLSDGRTGKDLSSLLAKVDEIGALSFPLMFGRNPLMSS